MKKKSTPGTTCTSKNTLTAGEICSIIRAGGKSGLQKLVFNGLSLEFGGDVISTMSTQPFNQLSSATETQPQMEFPGTDSDQDDFAELLAVEDPVAWERLQLEGDNNAENGHSKA